MSDPQPSSGQRPEEQLRSFEKEAEARWGRTEAFRQSRERVAKFTKEDWQRIGAETDANLRALTALLTAGKDPASPEVQAEIAKHHASIDRFYDCTPQIYRGLAGMYVADQRFTDFYGQFHAGLPAFLSAGMLAFCDQQEACAAE
ncbi:MAG: TipAS antibiotic-recognition domain-containing protein [Patescibacteria group bacterium]|jgi:hypothetical protein